MLPPSIFLLNKILFNYFLFNYFLFLNCFSVFLAKMISLETVKSKGSFASFRRKSLFNLLIMTILCALLVVAPVSESFAQATTPNASVSQSAAASSAGSSATSPQSVPNAADQAPDSKEKKRAETGISGPPITTVTRAVGEVGNRFVTSREVQINDAIEQALSDQPSEPGKGFKILSGQGREMPARVSQVLDEWAVYLEARNFSATEPNKLEVARVTKLILSKWENDASWKRLEVSGDELRLLIERKLTARGFVALKVDPATVLVTDDEAMAYFRRYRLRFGNVPFASVKDNIKAFLIKQQVDRRLADWRGVLRRRYKVRNFISG
jgi:hypothetical protein